MKRVYLFILIITLISIAGLVFTLWKLPPQNENGELIIRNIIIFGVSGTIFLTCFLGFILHFFHSILIPGGVNRDIFRQSLREGLFIALTIAGVFLFQKLAVLTIINVILLVLIFITLEGYILIRKNVDKKEKSEVKLSNQQN